jgi:protein O-GlcNAc transferase
MPSFLRLPRVCSITNRYPFTRFPILDRRQLGPSQHVQGKKVCFDRAVLTYPPRASYFYPTRGVGCSPSHMMTSFVDWMLRNMSLVDTAPVPEVVVLTFVIRGGPNVKTRLLLNEPELLQRLGGNFGDAVKIQTVDFEGMSFREQVTIVRQSHILAGMHGAGLTHLLWLPRLKHRVAVVEIYNSRDEFCYKDLAALGGVKYFTWEGSETSLHPEGGVELTPTNAKHVNFSPDPREFVALMTRAVEHVLGNPTASGVPHETDL